MAGLSPRTRTVLLTGATGFVGRQAIAPLLRRGFAVEAVSRHPAPVNIVGVTWHQVDLLDDDARVQLLARVRASHLLHLAWDVEPARFWTAEENEHWAAASLELVRGFTAQGGTRAVLVGSCAEYDWSRPGEALRHEDDPCKPANLYGRTKHRLAEEAAAHAKTAGASFAWARLFQMFGLYEYPQRLVPQVARALIAGQEVACTSGHQIRDYSDTRDVAAGLAALLDAEAVTGPVNVASGEAIAVREICSLIAELAGRPRKLLRFGALPDREGEPKSLVADVTRLRAEVGFTPTVLMEDRLADTVARYVRAGSTQPQFD